MQLLISVRSADEAIAARAGGADIIDAKEPAVGALGPVSLPTLHAIVAAVGASRPVTAAIGDADDAAGRIGERASQYAAAGARLVKLGFAGTADRDVGPRLAAAVRGAAAGAAGVIAVCYADAAAVSAPPPDVIVAHAAQAGTRGVLLDTAVKGGPGLRELMPHAALAAWVAAVRAHDMLAALAGQLSLADLAALRDLDAAVAGVRGAACDGGRDGRISADRVRALATAIEAGRHRWPTTAGPAEALARSNRR